jgi:hypothetical protein
MRFRLDSYQVRIAATFQKAAVNIHGSYARWSPGQAEDRQACFLLQCLGAWEHKAFRPRGGVLQRTSEYSATSLCGGSRAAGRPADPTACILWPPRARTQDETRLVLGGALSHQARRQAALAARGD